MREWISVAVVGVMLCACSEDEAAWTPSSTAGGGQGGTTSSGSGGTGATGTGAQGGTGGAPAPGQTLAELCARPDTIFCDGFEGAYKTDWIEDGGDVRIVAGAGVPGEGSDVVEFATYQGQGSSKLIYTFDNEPLVYVRFDVQYDLAYDNSGGSHGPILGGSMNPPWGMMGTAGIKPNGDDYFVLNFEPRGTVGEGGELGFYAYFVNMTTTWGTTFDSSLEPPPTIVPGSWHCAEYGLRLNTPGNTTDGTANFWVDGVHHGDFGDFQWRTIDGLQINTFNLDSYNHFNDGAPPESSPNLVRYDNVVVSRSPVGCLAP